MAFDLFQSRRNFNELCRWWTRNESDKLEDNELVHKRIPSGTFQAREVNAEIDDENVIGGIMLVRRTNVTIYSPDDLSNIKPNDLVEYQDEFWRVDDVQKRKAFIQNSEFAKVSSVSHYWYLTLTK